ncbi:MAG: hypothetical protein E5W57_19190 [Mesorhizobium sp.]|nr:MAG: hypothetical protein E5W57_19190 [Mesorhizobium sp.]
MWALITRLASAFREFVAPRYRPELYYMRGPGPASARRMSARRVYPRVPATPFARWPDDGSRFLKTPPSHLHANACRAMLARFSGRDSCAMSWHRRCCWRQRFLRPPPALLIVPAHRSS